MDPIAPHGTHGNHMARFSTWLQLQPKIPNGHSNLSLSSAKQQYLTLLKGCSSMEQLHQIHAQIQTSGLSQDKFLASEVLRFCALSPTGSLDYASFLLSRNVDPVPLWWNHVIRGYTERNLLRNAVGVFVEMRLRGSRPNKLTFPFLLKACAGLCALELGRQVHAEMVKIGVYSDVYVRNTLIYLYGSCKKILEAWRVFDKMPLRTVVSWNAILTAFVDNSWVEEALDVFLHMRDSETEPDETTLVVLLSASTELGNLSLGRWVHSQMTGKGFTMTVQLGTALINMYAKCGAIECAYLVFGRLPERNVWTWSAMILGFAQHGFAKEALGLFSDMKRTAIKPNYVTFLGVLCACSHAGLVDDGRRFFHDMANVHGIEPKMIHYSAMVDILGRRGCVEEAYDFIKTMPIEPNAVVWRTLLSACNVHSSTDTSLVRESARVRLLELEPRKSGNYVMVANNYAEVGLWNEAAKVRKAMREGGLKKTAAESCIEVSGMIFKFVSGDDFQVEGKNIYCLLDGLDLNTKLINNMDALTSSERFLY